MTTPINLQVGGFYKTRDGASVMITEQVAAANPGRFVHFFRGIFTDSPSAPTWWYPNGRWFIAFETDKDLMGESV